MRDRAEQLKARISRRKMLGGAAVGAAAAVATGAIGRVPVAEAANGDPLLLGQSNAATSVTSLTVQGTPNVGPGGLEVVTVLSSAPAIRGRSPNNQGLGIAGEGLTGVDGISHSINGAGVIGEDATGSSLDAEL